MAYIPLNIPNMPTTSNYSTTATWLADTADAVATSAASYIQSLSDLKDSDYFTVGDLPEYDPAFFYSGQLSAAAFVRPNRPDMTPPSITALIDRLNTLVIPEAPVQEFTFSEPGYASALRDPVIAKILGDLINGGYGIDTNDEAALWNRERDREAMVMQANIEELKRQAAAMSFPMPPGALYAAIQKARQEAMNKNSSVNRDIGLKRADMYVENRRKVIDQALASESQSIALYNAIQGRGLEIAKTEIALTIAIFESSIRAIELQFSAVLKQIEAQMEFSKAAVMVYNSDIAMYSAYVTALIADSRAYIDNQRNSLEADRTVQQSRTEQIRFRLQQLSMSIDNTKDINKHGAEFFRTGLGSALNGVNGLAVQTSDV